MTTYYVDAETGAPVGGELSIGTGPKWLKKSAPRLTFRVDTYQRFPDDQAHAYLLKIKRSPKTKIIVRSYAQVREKMRADRPINRQHRKQP